MNTFENFSKTYRKKWKYPQKLQSFHVATMKVEEQEQNRKDPRKMIKCYGMEHSSGGELMDM